MRVACKGLVYGLLLSFCMMKYVFAWNANAHSVIADIAYQQLNLRAKTKVEKFVDYFHNEYPNISDITQLAPWPDEIRGQKIETFTHWHYIDIAFTQDNTPLKDLRDSDNAVWALKAIIEIVRNEKANTYERARFLAFLIHIVGDLHQPLHTVSRISAKNPDGDKGGNLFTVYNNHNRTNLHRLWDSGLDVFKEGNSYSVSDISRQITQRYPKTYFGARANEMDFDAWVQEGKELAEKFVYNTEEDKPISAEYLNKGQHLAEEEVALAGYRLGALLNQLLNAKDRS